MKFTISSSKFTFILGIVLLLASCGRDTELSIEDPLIINNLEYSSDHLPADVLGKVLDLGLDPTFVTFTEVANIDGSKSGYVSFSGHTDTGVKVEDFLKETDKGQVEERQYRSTFIVDTDKFPVVNIYGYIGDDFPTAKLSEASQQALLLAVENWNGVNDRFPNALKLKVTFGNNPSPPAPFNTAVFAVPALDENGDPIFDGFAPSPRESGAPGGSVQIRAAVNEGRTTYTFDALVHLLTHEVGHSIGFRHSDWKQRESCVFAGITEDFQPEPYAQWIFGTFPSIPGYLYQDDSVMNACFSIDDVTGDLNFWDKIALYQLYKKW